MGQPQRNASSAASRLTSSSISWRTCRCRLGQPSGGRKRPDSRTGQHDERGQMVLAAFVQYAGRLPDEFGVLAMRDALAVAPRLLTLPDAQAWLARARQRGLFANAQ